MRCNYINYKKNRLNKERVSVKEKKKISWIKGAQKYSTDIV